MSELNAMSVEIAKLNIQSGDVLVVRCNNILSAETVERVREHFISFTPRDVRVLVIDETISLSVLTREDIYARAAA